MPLFLVDNSGKDLLSADESFWRQNMPKDLQFINIALINNMPDLALKDTERQFTQLLEAAAQNFCVRLTILSMPGAQRSEWAQRYVEDTYGDLAGLWSGRFDGIIVTGNEPREKKLSDEPYWPALTKIIDWSRTNSISSVWSCLAAHAAVYYMDSVEGTPFPRSNQAFSSFLSPRVTLLCQGFLRLCEYRIHGTTNFGRRTHILWIHSRNPVSERRC